MAVGPGSSRVLQGPGSLFSGMPISVLSVKLKQMVRQSIRVNRFHLTIIRSICVSSVEVHIYKTGYFLRYFLLYTTVRWNKFGQTFQKFLSLTHPARPLFRLKNLLPSRNV